MILICVDGMRPDGMEACGNAYVDELKAKCTYSMNAKTVYPSSTYPCHTSMFHSVPPQVHGTLVWYEPSENPVKGLMEQLHEAGARCGMFYNCEAVEECVMHYEKSPLVVSTLLDTYAADDTDKFIMSRMIEDTRAFDLDFVFLYMGQTDSKGHRIGWMSDDYLKCLSKAVDNIKEVMNRFGDEFSVVITTDHGGHEKSHGSRMDEDMNIPIFCCGAEFAPGRVLQDASILDIAPTVADVMGVAASELWQGKSLVKG